MDVRTAFLAFAIKGFWFKKHIVQMIQYKMENTGWVVFVVGCKTMPGARSASASTRCGPRWFLKSSSTLPQVFFDSSSFFLLKLLFIFSPSRLKTWWWRAFCVGSPHWSRKWTRARKKKCFFLLESACISSVYAVEVNVQHVQAAGLRRPARLPPATSLYRGERQTSLPSQPPGRLPWWTK